MADRKKATGSASTSLGAGMNSEHEIETGGVKARTKREAAERASRPAGAESPEAAGSPHRPRAAGMTEVDREAAGEGERLAARTAHEMSRHETLSRTPPKGRAGK